MTIFSLFPIIQYAHTSPAAIGRGRGRVGVHYSSESEIIINEQNRLHNIKLKNASALLYYDQGLGFRPSAQLIDFLHPHHRRHFHFTPTLSKPPKWDFL